MYCQNKQIRKWQTNLSARVQTNKLPQLLLKKVYLTSQLVRIQLNKFQQLPQQIVLMW